MSSPVGTWTLLSMSSRDEVTRDETKVWGDAPLGFLTYTEDGRMSAVLAAAGARHLHRLRRRGSDRGTGHAVSSIHRARR